jgi:PAS domain S-box-containing protein
MVEHHGHPSPEEEAARHQRWIAEIEAEWAPLFLTCPDAIYVYIDDEHKTCNQAFADLFGFSIDEFKAMESYLDMCVDEESIELVIHYYTRHFEEEVRPVTFDYTARRRDGSTFLATAFNIPIVHDGQLMLLCFIRPAEDDEKERATVAAEALLTDVGKSISPA